MWFRPSNASSDGRLLATESKYPGTCVSLNSTSVDWLRADELDGPADPPGAATDGAVASTFAGWAPGGVGAANPGIAPPKRRIARTVMTIPARVATRSAALLVMVAFSTEPESRGESDPEPSLAGPNASLAINARSLACEPLGRRLPAGSDGSPGLGPVRRESVGG